MKKIPDEKNENEKKASKKKKMRINRLEEVQEITIELDDQDQKLLKEILKMTKIKDQLYNLLFCK
jgi:hypothetical protein